MREWHRPIRAALLAGVAVLIAGCNLLWAAYGTDPWAPPPPWVEEPAFPEPTILATYTEGTASVEITRVGDPVNTVSFDRVGAGSSLGGLMGTTVNWRNDDGWVLTLTAYDRYSGDVAIQWINGLEVWRTDAYGFGTGGNRCVVQLDESSTDLVRGTATCYDLRWSDGLAPPFTLEPTYIDGEQPFAAEITFEATP